MVHPLGSIIKYGSIVLVCIAVLAAAVMVNQMVAGFPDFLTYWAAGRLILEGKSPYDPVAWQTIVYQIRWNFEYPMAAGLFFVPWGLLPYRLAYTLWIFLSGICMIAAALILLECGPAISSRRFLLPVLAGLVVFRPALVQMRNGQLAGVLILFFAAAVFLMHKQKDLAAGLLAGLLLLKPNLGIPILGLWSIWLLASRRFAAFSGVATSSLSLFGAGFLVDPGWLMGLMGNNSLRFSEAFGTNPTLWGFSNMLCQFQPSCQMRLGLLLTAVLITGLIFTFVRKKMSPFASASLCVSAAILCTPYLWGYDHILLLVPVVFIVVSLAARGAPFLAGGLVFPVFSAAGYVFLLIAVQSGHDIWSWMQVFACLIACWALIWMEPAPTTRG